ncbi:MAG TPA: SNF2-related protein [Verrucomicrobiota bacterium]|nr:SNF2-related protein [Verrucomicrobiota bacterium]HNU49553.1 SNF2-related protein [Verrucomicrobiota bacterium]
MPDALDAFSDLFLTPHGRLRVETAPLPSPWPDAHAAQRVARAFAESPAAGLLHLATRELDTVLPAAAGWWRELGRRYLTQLCHLAENKRHPTHPFAFMASYASRISSESRVQHLPLGRALQDYAGAGNKAALLNLLAPVQRAAEKSGFVRELVDSSRIFKPLPWTPAEAYQFLKDAPVCEEAGVIVRLPDWWKGGRPPRPRVSVRVGQRPGAGLGADTLLDFSVEATLGGEPLTDQEWQSLLQATEGLALVRGQWVEVDPDKLRDALAHSKKVERLSRQDGMSFFEGMRLIAGFQSGAAAGQDPAQAVEREWTGIEPGSWLEEVLAELRYPSRLGTGAPIPGLQAQLRPYQAVGANWLWFLARLGLGGCLADDMGLGKTLQVLTLLLRQKNETPPEAGGAPAPGLAEELPSILVVPASLLANWRAEITRFTPALRFVIAHPSEHEDPLALLESCAGRQADLVITTYGLVARLEAFRRRPWKYAILDEAQAIKNPGTRQARAVKELRATARFALTGTPIENRAGDLWSLFDFLNPGLLGSAAAFARFIRARDDSKQPDYGPLRALTRPYILRRLKTDKTIISDLPEKTEVRAWCSLTKTQAALYQQAVSELAGGIGSLVELLQGRFSDHVMGILTRKETGLFPAPAEIKLKCSCPDWATMCKHVAAVLYAVGARLDQSPDLLFTLRSVNHEELITRAASAGDLAAKTQTTGLELAESEIGAVCGIELDTRNEPAQPPAPTPPPPRTKKRTPRPRKTLKPAKPSKPARKGRRTSAPARSVRPRTPRSSGI